MAEETLGVRSPTWLRVVQVILGILIVGLGIYDIASPGTALGTLIVLLAIGLIISACVDFMRAFLAGIISGWWRALYVITAIISLVLAALVIANPFVYGSLTLVYLLGVSLLFAGITLAALGAPGSTIAGIITVILGIVVLVFPQLGIALAIALLAVSLIVIGVEAIVVGITGRQLGGWTWI